MIRFETEPGFQAQVDWKECGYRFVDGKRRKLYAFVMTLGYSRMLFVRYTTDMKSATLLACHIKAFEYFGGIPEEILYDNMKTAFVFDGEVWRPATRLAAFACHYRFIPRRCRVRRPETKGKVERSINYLEKNFHQRLGEGRYRLDELNEEALRWIDWIKGKPISGLTESREERFCHERGYLKPIPAVPFEIRDALPVMVNRESCITYRTNRYSVPPRFIGKQLIIRPEIGDQRIDVYANAQLIRTIALLPEGSHLQMFDPIDREAIRSRWEHDRDRQTRERLPRKRTRKPATVDVAVRHPAFYDLLVGDACNG